MAKRYYIGVRRQKIPHDLPLNPDPLAVYYADRQDIPLQTCGDICLNGITCLVGTELVKVQSAVDRILYRLIVLRIHTNKIADRTLS